ncbi:enoyl-CoA hydratase/isomerase family protein [Fluoribacter dumoffii]|uniref:3-hydroxyisobutyryl-CoA hydrolase n=1 Tax=Fluoribacter dumoffii TaxID=463 RepID=A0A377G8M9_9GAMM|nr:enoyl-CoA hydratase/isomerase family protein [Fluoribacter dumoffii]KTC89749.1 enoyl-CoA hydratase [Fluoribacter dumoffii NY 23]MCW8384944.1 enoyl-CoA hydratase/isomerase family protein [Fluoribacter dumoffii]MCW8418005.1 enoyl-CoA hydratase/isomerase family protein [Fluoribacter dumoffii]MCW8454153.1 enoyl-CoA hydratase/isomerase family protein [Fluoribacter dumoffii]MCW8461773.1 enoyl-CoA hydratase/isomerase family protein [Fluoribacter dumoffii]
MTDEVLFNQEGSLGVITLNRPKALNALTLNMILNMQRQLSLWKEDESIHAVLVRAVPGNAFCAGGDIRSLYFSGQVNDSEQMQFFWHEYRLNHFIHHLGKPYISLIDGIVMGGGVGISLHGSHPIASERFVFAMPETGIGFFPDIGASHLLTQCPGYLGIYLGLTGNRLGSHDAVKAGLVKKVIASEQMPALYDALISEDLSTDASERVNHCLQHFSFAPATDEISQIKPLIDVCFSHPSIEMIRESLQSANTVWAEAVDNTLAQKSPLSLKVTLAQLQKAKGLSLAQCLQMDYNIVSHFMHGHDFYEGVRALLIDKDKNPQWRPTRLDLVSEEMVDEYFERSHPGLEWV